MDRDPQARRTDPDEAQADPSLKRDLRTLVTFIDIYCRKKHAGASREPPHIKGFDVQSLAKGRVELCQECLNLLTHAFVKRANCPLKPKPACKHCAEHCYHRTYRARIQKVMRYSGRRLILSGRLDYLYHLLF